MKNIFIFFFILASFFGLAQKTEKTIIYFQFDKYALENAFKNKIDSVARIATIIRVNIEAHCDSIGSDKYNDALSMRRAGAVKEYLLTKSIKESQIEIKSHGKRQPLNNNSSETERALNRRAEIIFTIADSSLIKKADRAMITIPVKKTEDSLPKQEDSIAFDARFKDSTIYDLEDVKVGSAFKLENLNFYPGRHKLLARSWPILFQLLNTMKAYPNLQIEIDGHICCMDGNVDGPDWDSGDNHLSVNRAKAIYDYLVEHGIDRRRLSYKGFGASQKLFPVERTEAEAEMNRRVEIRILKK